MELPKKIALVHDWLVSMRGGEKVLEALCEIFPDASLFSLVHSKDAVSPIIEKMKIRTSFIQHLPFSKQRYQYYLPLYPAAVAQFDLSEFDLVISSSHAAAKGVRVRKDALHICYCHTPMRYIWDQYEQYFGKGRTPFYTRMAMRIFLNYLRQWDVKTAKGVNYFIANSRNVQERIKRIYNRDSEVIYPPVDVQRFSFSEKDEGYYLIVSALVPYKRIDLAVEAFNNLGEPLLIVGDGSEELKLKASANKNIEFLGWVNDYELLKCYSNCRALIFPGEEDFGIVPVEAMACGKPIVAYRKGGALETIVEGKSGLFFSEQRVENIIATLTKLNQYTFDGKQIREHAMQFDKANFTKSIGKFIQDKWDEHHLLS